MSICASRDVAFSCASMIAVLAASSAASATVLFSGRSDPQGSPLYHTAVNATGSRSGGYVSTGGNPGFLWTNPALNGATQALLGAGNNYSIPYGFSRNDSFVVGVVAISSTLQAARWPVGGSAQSLGAVPGGSNSIAWGSNVDGSVIVGETNSPTGTIAFRWTSSNGMQPLGAWTLGNGGDHVARAITPDASVIVGYGRGASGWDVFRWTGAGGYQNLTRDAGITGGGQAWSVSDDGSVIAGYMVVGSQNRAFRWTSGGGFQNLGVLPGGGTASIASAVSADGSMVVGSSSGLGLGTHAFLWTSSLGMVDLNTYLPTLGVDLGSWVLDGASGISADGTTIIGQGHSNGTSQSKVWAVRLPAPSTAAVLALGGGWVTRRRRSPASVSAHF